MYKVFNGYLRITNENFLDAYEDPNSTEFANLAQKVKEAVSDAASGRTLSPGGIWLYHEGQRDILLWPLNPGVQVGAVGVSRAYPPDLLVLAAEGALQPDPRTWPLPQGIRGDRVQVGAGTLWGQRGAM